MQLDRVPPPRDAAAPLETPGPNVPGTDAPPPGVCPDDRCGGDGDGPAQGAGAQVPPHRVRAWQLVMVGLAAFALLGQGERCQVDPRFGSPSATLSTYWSALRDGDSETVAECVVDGVGQPFPGMLWFMPPTREVRLGGFRSLPVSAGRLYVTYEVSFRPLGALEEQRFETGHELVRLQSGWHIARGLGEASLPEWQSIPRAVDS
jgi:hypothetical protein